MNDDSRRRGVLRGHMSRARKVLKENLRLVDGILEVADARIPATSRHPAIREWTGSKPLLVILNKRDLADPCLTERWLQWYNSRGRAAVSFDARSGDGKEQLLQGAENLGKTARGKRRGPLRLLTTGLPNVGKSSLLNRLAGQKRARTGANPGITRGEQWIKASSSLQLLDLPGILTPTLGGDGSAWRLLTAGIIGPEDVVVEDAALDLLRYLLEHYPDFVHDRYGVSPAPAGDSRSAAAVLGLMEAIGRNRGCLVRGGEIDWQRTANLIVHETRQGLLGRISLEVPPGIDAP